MGGYRDEREAERARIEALERDLEEARERAARAEAEAAAARAEASSAKGAAAARSAREDAAPRPKKSRAERKREKSRRAAAASGATSAVTRTSWSDVGRGRYFRASYALSLVGYCAAGGAVATADGEEAMTKAGAIAFALAATGVFLGHFVIGRLTRAPGVFNGAMVTLLSTSVTLGGALVAVVLLEETRDWLSGSALMIARGVAALLALMLGSFVTAHWSSDAASSDTTVGD